MKRESSEELTVEEIEEMLKHLDHKVEKYDQAIEASENVSKRKELRSARKKPKQDRKALQDYIVRNKSIKMICLFLMAATARSEEHTSELQSRGHLVCRLLLEKTKIE